MKGMLNIKEKSWFKPGMNMKGAHKRCLCCPGPTETLKMNTRLHFGFGGWTIHKDGLLFFQGPDDYDKAPTLIKP